MAHKGGCEALANIYWDKEESRFIVDIPEQKVSRVSVSSKISDAFDSGRYMAFVSETGVMKRPISVFRIS